ncbi:glycosyl transferase family 9 [candidate division LCP-89 bacterium B3_LCP]|uniref:Glycosyl transferase family 9 n=1 Tax=candidate division LCP-89 bacterium B3_LCP TaxID=2012998 RepID=A0A532V5P2_UNCL8|nr:MAG: glycosyl transferase family 9 [candidate division LCP-89 bacterium B3_LCP]
MIVEDKLGFSTEVMVHTDCRHFLGDRPCKPHKSKGVHCEGCEEYDPISKRILIIKLGAVGDVIRTTPLLHVLKKPGVHITWLTETPEVIPQRQVDRIFKLDASSLAYLQATSFDVLYNLDKDSQAIALCKLVKAKEKFGFTMKDGVCEPIDDQAHAKWLTGLFDDLNQKNRLSYLDETFAMCGLQFKGERYIIELDGTSPFDIDLPRPLIGLNTGCGARWPSRLWAFENWAALIRKLQEADLGVLLLGGPDEDEKNKKLAETTGAAYAGYFPLQQFFHLVNEVDVLVTGVTMALHIGIGLDKRIVLFNNIFNRNEFELYDLGQIIEPDVDCLGCFKPVCEDDCMNLLKPDQVFEVVSLEAVKVGAGGRAAVKP